MKKLLGIIAFALVVIGWEAFSVAEVVIQAENAAIKTEGGPVAGGWNLWSNGHVGQVIRVTTPGKYGVVVRAWGSPAGGVWPEMALLVDGRAVKTVSVEGANPKDYAFQVELTAEDHEIAAAFLNDALVGNEDRNLYLARITISPPSGASDPTFPTAKEMAEAAEAREQEIVAATKPAIEKNRKADAKFRVVDGTGRPVLGAKITIEQTGHDFLFGANIFGFDRYKTEAQNAEYKKRFEELLNYATVGFYWRWYEPQRGKPGYEHTDKVVAWCREHGIRMKGHPLLWADEAGIPVWSPGQPSPEIQRQRVENILHRYGGKIEFWEVVNEPSHLPSLKIDDPYRWARQADPNAYLIVNDYHVLPDGAPAFFKLLTEAKQNGVPFGGIGIQAHEPRTMRFPLDRVQKVLDQYATLDKELHITEFEPAGAGQKITGSHREGIWDEAAQADYAVKFYRVCFAHPAIRAITWWDLGDQGSFIPGGGMLRRDLSPKPVYEQLKRLIHEEWKTRASGTTDAEGRFGFRGFFGTYKVVIVVDSKAVEKQFHLGKGDTQEITVSIDNVAKGEPVMGTVVVDGKPVAKAQVIFSPMGKGDKSAATTDETGRFTGSLKPGQYRVEIRPMAEKSAPGPKKADKGVPINGIISFQGKPVAKAQITFHPAGKGDAVAIQTDEEGKYAGSLPVGQYRVAVRLIRDGRDVLPARYGSPETTGLMVEVKQGQNTFDFSLQ